MATILTPIDGRDELVADDVAALVDELRKIADGCPRLAAASALADRLERGGEREPDEAERYVLLRATNHLTRSVGASRPSLISLRDRIDATAALRWIEYRLRFDDGRREDFASFTLQYEPGDRLVTRTGAELRVVDVEPPEHRGTPELLVVERWQRADA